MQSLIIISSGDKNVFRKIQANSIFKPSIITYGSYKSSYNKNVMENLKLKLKVVALKNQK